MPRPGQAIRARVKLGREPGDCWTWNGPITNGGHAKLTFCGRDTLAHRWLWEQLFGPIPDGWVVYSTCASKECINPHHLACGTQAKACRNSVQTVLMPDDVSEIRSVPPEDRRQNMAIRLAEKIGCSVQSVRDVWRGVTWSHGRKFRGPKRPRNQHSAMSA